MPEMLFTASHPPLMFPQVGDNDTAEWAYLFMVKIPAAHSSEGRIRTLDCRISHLHDDWCPRLGFYGKKPLGMSLSHRGSWVRRPNLAGPPRLEDEPGMPTWAVTHGKQSLNPGLIYRNTVQLFMHYHQLQKHMRGVWVDI